MKNTGITKDSIMNTTNLNYTAPEMEIISIETQNCFASSSQASYSISSNKEGLGELNAVDADWN